MLERLGGQRGQQLRALPHRQLLAHIVVGRQPDAAQPAGVVKQAVGDERETLGARGEEVLAGHEGLVVETGLGHHHAAVARRLQEADPLHRRRLRAVQVQQHLRGAEPLVLVHPGEVIGSRRGS